MNTTCTITSRKGMGARRGFSVAELLLCSLILALSTTVITSTLSLGVETFQENTRRSEQLMLLNTLSVSVQEYLTYAQDVRTGEGGALETFTTGAMAALRDAECRLITAVSNDNGATYQETTDPGELALFIHRDGEDRIYPLADRSQYIRRKGRASALALEASAAVNFSRTTKQFTVTITVYNLEGNTGDVANEFIVTPVHVKPGA